MLIEFLKEIYYPLDPTPKYFTVFSHFGDELNSILEDSPINDIVMGFTD